MPKAAYPFSMAVLLLNLSRSSRDQWEQTLVLARDFTRHSLAPEGEKVRLVCAADSDLAVAANSASIPLVELNAAMGAMTLYFTLRRLVREFKATLVYTFDPRSLKHMALLRGVFGFGLVHTFSGGGQGRDFIRDRRARKADFLVIPNEDAAEVLRAGIQRDRIRTIFPVYALQEQIFPPARALARAVDEHFIFVAACELSPDKGVDTLIRAMSYLQDMAIDLPPWEVRVAGQGPLFAELLASAETMGVAGRLALLGDQPRIAIMRDAHAILATSTAGRGDATFIFDAWAMRLPVACTSLPAHQGLGQDKTAFLLSPPGNPVALAGSMLRLLTEPETRARLIRGGSAALAAHDPLLMARHYAALGEEARESRRRSGPSVDKGRG